jgi:hypothetical protein
MPFSTYKSTWELITGYTDFVFKYENLFINN